MVEHLNERIDTMLSQIYESEFNLKKIGSFHDYYPNQRMDYYVSQEVAQIMVEERLIKIEGDGACSLKNLGRQIASSGGWLESVKEGEILNKRDKIEEQKREATESLRTKKLKHDYIRAKWQTIVFWPLVFLGLAGGIYGTIDFIRTPSIEGDVESLKQTIQEMEVELSKQRTLILSQRNLDSLRNSKTPDDSLRAN